MTYDFEVSTEVAASREEVFDAWLDSAAHSQMTGGAAEIDPRVGGVFGAWDGYITGTTTDLERPSRIVQSWRTSDFGPEDADSMIEVTLETVARGAETRTRVTLRHRNVPADQRGYEQSGWREFYFEPMVRYFGS